MVIAALSHAQPDYTNAAILRAIRTVESGGNYNAVHDVCRRKKCKSHHVYRNQRKWHGHGAYGFQYQRWVECCGINTHWIKKWRENTGWIQDEIMKHAISRYRTQAGPRWKTWNRNQRIAWICNCHNIGHGSLRRTKYVNKVLKLLNSKPNKKGK